MQPWDPRSHQSTSAKSAPALTHATKTTNTKAAIPKLIVRLPDSALVLAKHERRLDEVGEARELLLAEHRLHEGEDALRRSRRRHEREDDTRGLRPRRELAVVEAPKLEHVLGELGNVRVVHGGAVAGGHQVLGQLLLEVANLWRTMK